MENNKNAIISVGIEVYSRRGRLQGIVSNVNSSGFILTRPSGKTVKITNRKVESTFARLVNGETLAYQRNPGDGGISYTVAIERGVIAALGGWVIETPTGYKLKE